MMGITVGVTSSSFHAIRCLQKTVEEFPEDNPVRQAILRDFNVDYYLGGADTIEIARELLQNAAESPQRLPTYFAEMFKQHF